MIKAFLKALLNNSFRFLKSNFINKLYIYMYIYIHSLLLKFDFKNLKQLFHKAFKKALIIS